MLTQNVFRAANQLIDDSPCPVCRERMGVRFDPKPGGVAARSLSLPRLAPDLTLDTEFMTETEVVKAILGFADRAFIEEARSPDLRELIAYNRGALPC